MNSPIKLKLLLLFALVGALGLAAAQGEDPNAPKLAALEKTAQSFVNAYNKGDAEAISKLFLPEGELVVATGQVVSGRQAIADFYARSFVGEEAPKAALEAGSVRFVTPGIAIEDGTLHVTAASGEVLSHHYTAVKVQQEDGSWLHANVRDHLEDRAPASEKMIALKWIIGDWQMQVENTITSITFDWSEHGPYIDGKAVTEIAGVPAVSTTWRLGWDARRKGYAAWAFDAGGGFSHSEWTLASDNSWLLRTNGVTADGEGNVCTQVVEVDPTGESFKLITRDQTIGDVVQPDRTVTLVRRPPHPQTSKPSGQK